MAGRRCYSGQYIAVNPQKYRGDVNKIVFRSSWERRVMFYLDTTPGIIQWSSEEIAIPYLSDLDGRMHRYFVDFWAKVRDFNGVESQKIIEVKPDKETRPPKPSPKKKPERYADEVRTYVTNRSKWRAATIWAEKRGMTFIFITEKTLGMSDKPKKPKKPKNPYGK